VAWLSPGASPQLVGYVVNATRQVSSDPQPGHRVTGPIEDVLRSGDPEPATAFAVLADAPGQREAVLHGAVQLWDGNRWVLPQPPHGWLHCTIHPGAPVLLMAAGTPPPTVHPDSPLDLGEGVVIGAGVILVPGDDAMARAAQTEAAPVSQPALSESAFAQPSPSEALPSTVAGGSPLGEAGQASPAVGTFTSAAQEAPSADAAPPASVDAPPAEGVSSTEGAATASAEVAPQAGTASPGETATSGETALPGEAAPAGEPAPPAGAASPAEADAVVSAGPSSGVLLAEDGSSYRLDGNYVVGSEPDADDAVRWGGARSLRLAGPGDRVAPVHAEIRVIEGSVQVVDRGSGAGSFVLPQGEQQWSPLTPGQPHNLAPDSHLAFGQRVFLFVSHVPH
jgi:hypothetical protein